MSRIGKQPVEIPDKVKVTAKGKTLQVEGPKGKLSFDVFERISFKQDEKQIVFERPTDSKSDRAFHGTVRSIVASMVQGVSVGFVKNLEIVGVGYRGEQKGKSINLNLGYSHPILYTPPAGIEVKMDGNNKISISGADKQVVGQVAAIIRGFREPEPYKGKGVRYTNEYVRRKEVKKS